MNFFSSKIKQITFVILFVSVSQFSKSQGIAINNSNASADSSAMLDISSTTKGLLIPRMTEGDRSSITNPATGLLVYQTDQADSGFWYYNGSHWSQLMNADTTSVGWKPTGNYGTDPSINFIGTNDNVGLSIRTNSTESIKIDSAGNVGIGVSSPAYHFQSEGQTVITNNGMGIYNVDDIIPLTFPGVQFSGAAVVEPWGNYYFNGIGKIPQTSIISGWLSGNGNAGSMMRIDSQSIVNEVNTSTMSSKLSVDNTGITFDYQNYTLSNYTNLGFIDTTFQFSSTNNQGHFNAQYSPTIWRNILSNNSNNIFSSITGRPDNVYMVSQNNNNNSLSGFSVSSSMIYGSTVYGMNDGTNVRMDSAFTIIAQQPNMQSEMLSLTEDGQFHIGIDSSGKNSSIAAFNDELTFEVNEPSQGTHFNITSTEITATASSTPLKFGIGTNSPISALDVAATSDPIHISGLSSGSANDSILTIDNAGIVKRINASSLTSNSGWGISGNAGTVDVTNFIGTIDNVPLTFKVNGIMSGKIDNAISNVFLGYKSGSANTTGDSNSFFGSNAGENNTSGQYNLFIGASAGKMNTTGSNNQFIGFMAGTNNTTGDDNFFVGSNAGYSSTTAIQNHFVGNMAGYSNTSGNYNQFEGFTVGFNNTTGSSNTALGSGSFYSNTTGSDNVALGRLTLNENSTGSSNVAIGLQSLQHNTTGYSNVAVGYIALLNNVSGLLNTAVGAAALANNTGNENTAVGGGALYTNTSGEDNVAIGFGSLQYSSTGSENTAIGAYSMNTNTTGTENTAVGNESLSNNTTGSQNSAVGNMALSSNTTGYSNAAVGYQSLFNNTTGNENTALGIYSLFANTTGYENTGIGSSALASNTTGYGNTSTGWYALESNTTGNSNSAFGSGALTANTSGNFNSAFGTDALLGNTTGYDNTAFGKGVLSNNITGFQNTSTGVHSLESNSTGSYNVAGGIYALNLNTTGSDNTALGNSAGMNLVTGSGNLFLGSGATTTIDSVENSAAIGYNAVVAADNSMVFGGTGGLAIKAGINTTTPNSRLQVNGSFATAYLAVYGNYTLTINDAITGADANAGATTITLPTAGGIIGRQYTIKKIDGTANSVTVQANGSETIDGSNTVVLTT